MFSNLEIEVFIRSKLENLHVVDEIHQILNFDDLIKVECNFEGNHIIDELYNEYNKLKEQLQLKNSLNKEYGIQLLPNNSIPVKTDVFVANLILHYFQSLAKLLKFEKLSQNILIPTKCCYCESELNINDSQCSLCLTPIEEVLEFLEKNERKQSENTEKSILDKVNSETSVLTRLESAQQNYNGNKKSEIEIVENGLVNGVPLMDGKIEVESNMENELNYHTQQYNENMINYNLLSNNDDKWLCEKCQNLNLLANRDCLTCDLINKLTSDKRSDGGENKTNNIKSENFTNNQIKCNNATNSLKQNDKKSKEIPITWTCWNNNCKQDNTENDIFCKVCKLQKEVPNVMSDDVKCYLKDTIHTVWICRNCYKRNDCAVAQCSQKNCNSYRFYVKPETNGVTNNLVIDKQCLDQGSTNSEQWPCIQCTFMNENKSRICEVCGNKKNNNTKKTKVKNLDIWYCWNPGCLSINFAQHLFCQYCHLTRHENKDQGAVVEIKNGETSEHIWICWTCYSFNELGNTECKKQNCPMKRFKKKK